MPRQWHTFLISGPRPSSQHRKHSSAARECCEELLRGSAVAAASREEELLAAAPAGGGAAPSCSMIFVMTILLFFCLLCRVGPTKHVNQHKFQVLPKRIGHAKDYARTVVRLRAAVGRGGPPSRHCTVLPETRDFETATHSRGMLPVSFCESPSAPRAETPRRRADGRCGLYKTRQP